MSAIKRIEFKFPLRHGALGLVERNLVAAVPSLVRPYPQRTVHSVYRDSLNHQDYFDNVAGTTPRQKVRLRWYGENRNVSALEIKEKYVRVSWKHVLKITNGSDVVDVLNNPLDVCSDEADSRFKYALNMRPLSMLYVKYDRKYFTTARNIRFTIDTNIQFSDPAHMALTIQSPVAGVLEVKFPAELEEETASYIQKLNLQYLRHSKYVIGMDCMYY